MSDFDEDYEPVFGRVSSPPTLLNRAWWRVRVWWCGVRAWASYWRDVAIWTWRTRRLPKSEITLAYRADAACFWPGQVIGASTGDGEPVERTRLVRIDFKRGVLICAREAA